jgi:hypothetical protein
VEAAAVEVKEVEAAAVEVKEVEAAEMKDSIRARKEKIGTIA